MTYDQAQSPRLGQRTPVESTYVRMFSGGEVPEAAWPGQIIYINEEQILQIYNGTAWEDIAGGTVGQLTFVGSDIPTSQSVGDVWFNTADSNRMYVAKSVGANEIKAGEWEVVTGEAPPITSTTHIYHQDTPPTVASSPPPKDNDFWYETPQNKQYYYQSTAPGLHWVLVRDTGIQQAQDTADAAQETADAAQSTADTKIQTYYEPGFIPDESSPTGYLLDPDWVNPDPENDPDAIAPNLWVPIVGKTVGDTWYQTDDRNHPYYYNGTVWLDAKDPNINMITPISADVAANSGAIADLNLALEEVSLTATSANNSADTADGRVSMSDYNPGQDDVTYEVTRLERNEETGLPELVTVAVPRVNGSIWFTRTRPRSNICTNPSLETNLNGWSSDSDTTFEQMAHTYVPAGLYTIHVYSGSLAQEHWISWGESSRPACVEGQVYTASVYAELVSGNGLGLTLTLRWYDAGDALISTDVGPALDLAPGGFDPNSVGTMAEPRMWVTGTAPENAVSFAVREVSPASNAGDQWHTGAMLVEQEDDLGRYFDGDSYDCSWEATAHGSISTMEGDKIIAIWELRDQDWIRKYFTENAIYSIDASKLTGSLDALILADNTIAPDKMIAAQVLASEALQAGDLVHIWNSSGSFRVRKADALAGYEAHGFVLDSATLGSFVPVFHQGYNPFMVNQVPGVQFLAAAGKVTGQPPWAVGQIAQRVGFAPTTSVLNFSPMQPIKII